MASKSAPARLVAAPLIAVSVWLAAACGSDAAPPRVEGGAGTANGAAPSGGAGAEQGGEGSGIGGAGGGQLGGAASGGAPAGAAGAPAGASGEGGEGGEGAQAGAGGGPGALDAAGYCEAYAAAVCDWRQRCIMDDCTTWGGYVRFVSECANALSSRDAGFLEYSPENAAECLALVEGYACGKGPPFNFASLQPVCSHVFSGTVAVGGECASADFAAVYDECDNGRCERATTNTGRACRGNCVAFQQVNDPCSSELFCQPGLFCNEGTCEAEGRGVGESCVDAVCAANLSCTAEPRTCRSIATVGQACADSFDCSGFAVCVDDQCKVGGLAGAPCKFDDSCDPSAFCSNPGAQQFGACVARVAAGGDCNPNIDRCVLGYACGFVSNECEPELGALNGPCGPNGCQAGLWCNYTEPYIGTCLAPSASGGPCDSDGSCQAGLLCGDDAKCQPPGELNEPCLVFNPDSCTGDLFCARGTETCSAPRTLGQTCNPAVPSCQAGLYCACLSADCPNIDTGNHPEDVCVARAVDGAACTDPATCLGGYCLEGKCASSPPQSVDCSR